MTIIQCINPCLYEEEGECTLTHVTSVSNPQERDCVYFKGKNQDSTDNSNHNKLDSST